MGNIPLSQGDERLPAVRARLFLLVRSLWKAGILQVPLSLSGEISPALRLLHPLWRRLRVELLGEQLLRDILPSLERSLAATGELYREEVGLSGRGPVDWPATWRLSHGAPAPTSLVTRHWDRSFALPENLLAHHCLIMLRQDAGAAIGDAMSAEEAAPLRRLRERARQRLSRPPWRSFPDEAAPAFLGEAEQRIRRGVVRAPAYRMLLAWWQQWERPGHPTGGSAPLLDPALEPDWLFELLVLFDLVASLARLYPIRQSRALGASSRHPLFTAHTPAGPLLVYYQSGAMFAAQRSLGDIGGIPDVVLQLPGDPPTYVILDAKNYGPRDHTQALYKMLGYLYQFGYDPSGRHAFDRVRAGILAFPTEEREGTGLRNWQRDFSGAQAVMSYVLPLLGDERYTGSKELLERISRFVESARFQ